MSVGPAQWTGRPKDFQVVLAAEVARNLQRVRALGEQSLHDFGPASVLIIRRAG